MQPPQIAQTYYQLGAEWRQDAETAPVLDVRLPVGASIKARHAVKVDEPVVAWMTRDTGYYSAGTLDPALRLLPDPAFENCLHLSLACKGRDAWAMRHDVAAWVCEGAFGLMLPFVWVQRPQAFSTLSRASDVNNDVYRFRLFTTPDWQMPLAARLGVTPTAHIPWAQYRLELGQ